MVKKGLFIAFEGIDGSGKSTQAKMLADYIISLNKYNHVLRTREPYQDQNIRKILQQEEDPYSQGIKLAMMFTDDRRNHVNKLIKRGESSQLILVFFRWDLSMEPCAGKGDNQSVTALMSTLSEPPAMGCISVTKCEPFFPRFLALLFFWP